jgi:hypothetical protein
MTDKQRYVFDTNVLVSAALFYESTPDRALTAALSKGSILLSQETAEELKGVLMRPKFNRYVSIEARNLFLAALLQNAAILEPGEQIRACRDPKDDKWLEVAVAGRATCVITGDNDLLTLDPFRGIRIVTPAQFLESVAKQLEAEDLK